MNQPVPNQPVLNPRPCEYRWLPVNSAGRQACQPKAAGSCWLLPVLMLMLFVQPVAAQPGDKPKPSVGKNEQFIPVEELDALFARDRGGVLMPRSQFRELLAKAQLNSKDEIARPAKLIVEQVSVHVRPNDQHAVVMMEVQIRQFEPGWQIVSLPVGNLLIESSEIAEQPTGQASTVVARDPSDSNQVIIANQTVGPVTVRLTMSTPMSASGSDRSAAFRLPQTASTNLTAECPAGQFLLVNELPSERPASDDVAAVYEMPLGSADQVRLKWTAQRQQSESQTLAFVHSDVAIQIQKEAIRWHSASTVSVFGGSINQLIALVPAQLEVTEVESTGLASWQLEDVPELPDMVKLVLSYRQPFTSDRLVQISAIAGISVAQQQQIPSVEFSSVTSHSGRLVISHDSDLRLTAEPGAGIRTVADTPAEAARKSGVLMFDFWLQKFELSVAARPRDREIFAELSSTLSLHDRNAVFISNMTLETLNAPLFDFTLALPSDWQITSLRAADNQADWRSIDPVENSTPSSLISVTLSKPVNPGDMLQLSLTMSRTLKEPETEQQFELPVASPLDATIVGGTYSIQFARDLSVAPVSLTGLEAAPGSETSLNFRNVGTTLSGQLTVVRREARLAARSVLRVWADARQQTTEAEVTIDVMHGSVAEVTVRVPEDFGEDVYFRVTGTGAVPGFDSQPVASSLSIIEQNAQPVIDGMRPFTLRLSQRFAGSLTLATTVQKPRVLLAPISAPRVQVVGAIRQHGVLVFEAYPEQQLQMEGDAGEFARLFTADAGLANAPAAATGRRVALTYRFVQSDYQFQIRETRFETEPVPSAVITSVINGCLLNETGTIQRSCRATFQSTGVQTIRFSLPDAEQSFLWSAMLNSEPIEVRRDAADYLVAVPATKVGHNGINQFTLEIVFETSHDSGLLGHIEQSPVRFAFDSADRQTLDISILQQTWNVHYPQQSLLAQSQGFLSPVEGTDQVGWLQRLSTMPLPKQGLILQRSVLLSLLVLTAFATTFLVIKRRWKTMTGLGLACLLLVTTQFTQIKTSRPSTNAYLQESPAALKEPAAAGRYGDNFSKPEEGTIVDYANSQVFFDMEQAADGVVNGPDSGMGGFGGAGMGMGMGMGMESQGQAGGGMFGISDESLQQAKRIAGEPTSNTVASTPNISPQNAASQLQILGLAVQPQQAQTNADPFAAGTSTQPTESQDITQGDMSGTTTQSRKKGSARLSVNVGLEVPDDYRVHEFRSVGDPATTPTSLQIVLLHKQQIAAIRLLAALVVVISFWWQRNASLTRQVCRAIVLILLTVAAIPFVPSQWQGLLDGTVAGAVTAITCLCLRATSGTMCNLCRRICGNASARTAGTSAAAALLFVFHLTVGSSAIAQDRPGLPDSGPTTNDPDLNPSVVVPYSDDQPVLRADKVFIEQAAFERLFRRAYPDLLPESKKGPVASQVLAAFYKADQLTPVEGTRYLLRVNARYVAFHDSDAAANVVLPIGDVAIRSATVNGTTAILVPVKPGTVGTKPDEQSVEAQRQEQKMRQHSLPPQAETNSINMTAGPEIDSSSTGVYAVTVTGKMNHIIDVQFDVAVQLEGETGQFEIPFRPVAIGTLELTIPQLDLSASSSAAQEPPRDSPGTRLDFRINGRSNVFRRDQNTIILPIAASRQTQIRWQPTSVRSSNDTVFHASSASALALQDDGLTWLSTIDISCRQGELSELEVVIPEGYAVQSVTGSDVAGWSVQNTDATRTVWLQFQSQIKTTTQLQLRLFNDRKFDTSQQSLEVPVPVVRQATRDSGIVALLAGSQFQVRSDSLSGVAQLNPQDAVLSPSASELETSRSARRLLAWRYTRHPARITVRAARTSDRVVVTALHAMRLETQRQLWTSQFTVQISGSPQRQLDVEVPEDFLVLDVKATDLSDWFFSTAAMTPASPQQSSTRMLTVQLQRATTGTVSIVIQGQLNRDSDRTRLTLLPPEILQATAASTQLAVWLDAASENAGIEAGKWKLSEAADVSADYQKLTGQTPSLAFISTQKQPGSVAVKLRRAVPTLIGESVTVTNNTDTSVDYTVALNWQVARAAADSFAVDLPTAVATALNFDVPNQRRLVRQVNPGGTTRILIQLQQPVSDRLFVLATGSVPLPANGVISAKAPEFISEATTEDANSSSTISGQSHFWVVVNQSSGLLLPSADHKDTEVAPELITTSIPAELLQQAVTVQRLKPETPGWQLKFPEQHQVSPAVVTLATHLTVVAEDGSWRSRHTLSVRNQSRQFLPVQIPKDSRILYCTVQQQPTRIVSQNSEDPTRVLIPVPQSGAIATVFEVQFALAGQLPGSFHQSANSWNTRDLQIPLPVFPEFRDNPEFGITVARNRWTVYLPDSWHASLKEDPRLTNVVPATEADFEDASLLSSVEQTNWLLNSLSAANDGVSRRALLRELQKQQAKIGQINANSPATLLEQQQLMQKLLNQTEDSAIRGDLGEVEGMSDPGQRFPTDNLSGNMFLYEQDLNQNQLLMRGNSSFLIGNRGTGTEQLSLQSLAFNFQLLPQQQDQTAKPTPPLPDAQPSPESLERSPRSGKDKSIDQKPGGSNSQSGGQTQPPQKSKLLLRKQSGVDQQSEQREYEQLPSENGQQSAIRFNRIQTDRPGAPNRPESALGSSAVVEPQANQTVDELTFPGNFAPGLTDRFEQVLQQNISGGLEVDSNHNGPSAASSTFQGMLSLQFDIPAQGQRLNFMRPGGNSALTLRVKSQQSVQKGYGTLWAIGCITAALLLTGATNKRTSLHFWQRLFLLLVIVMAAGWLLAPADLTKLFFLLTVGCLVAYCGLLAARGTKVSA